MSRDLKCPVGAFDYPRGAMPCGPLIRRDAVEEERE